MKKQEKEMNSMIQRMKAAVGEKPFIAWERAKDRIFPKLINTQKNRERISTMAHREILDLTVVYDIELRKDEDFRIALPVTKDMFQRWEIAEEELFETAFRNLEEKNGLLFEDIYTVQMRVLEEISVSDDENVIIPDEFSPVTPEMAENAGFLIYILTSSDKRYGAAFLALPSALREISKTLQDDFLILPSSVHEVLVMKKSAGKDAKELAEIVRSVNRMCVSEEEQLSDHVYCYEQNALRIAA